MPQGKYLSDALRLPVSFYKQLLFRYGFSLLTNPLKWEQVFQKLELRDKYPDPTKLKVFHMYPLSGIIPCELQRYLGPQQQLLMEPGVKARSFQEKKLRPVINEVNKKIKNGKITYTDETAAKEATEVNFTYSDKDPFVWTSLTDLVEDGTFVPVKEPRDKISETCLAIGNYSNAAGEGLMVQHMNCFANSNWIQRYGRVRTISVLSDHSAAKFLGERNGKEKMSRLSLYSKAFSEVKLVAASDVTTEISSKLIAAHDPVILNQKKDFYNASCCPIAVLSFEPKNVPENLDLEHFDYVTKQLFIMYNTPLEQCINLLGFGAIDWFINEPEFKAIKDLAPQELSVEQFYKVTELFGYWPFKPDVLLSFEEDKNEATKR